MKLYMIFWVLLVVFSAFTGGHPTTPPPGTTMKRICDPCPTGARCFCY